MSQFTAINGIPFLAYENIELEDIVCTRKRGSFVFRTIQELLDEADRLIRNRDYRLERGNYLKSLISDQETLKMVSIIGYPTRNPFVRITAAGTSLLMQEHSVYNMQIESTWGACVSARSHLC